MRLTLFDWAPGFVVKYPDESVSFDPIVGLAVTSSNTPATTEPTLVTPARHGAPLLVAVFAVSIFVNAALLFSVQPLFTKMVLPLLGGTPAVWNTCLLFFQAVLLGGYLYAHVSSKYLTVRAQAILHVALLLVALLFLPIQVPESWAQPPDSEMPIGWLLGLLTISLGLPFFLLSAGAPMMQRWFAGTRHPSAQNPYFLYAASNLGSLAALLGYPFVIEPRLRISQQAVSWLVAYVALIVVIAACATVAFRNRRVASASSPITPDVAEPLSAPNPTLVPDSWIRLRWVQLSFVPSSMLIGVTTYLSTDIASVPFLWVIPLALYLLTFVVVFARRQLIPRELVLHAQLLLGLPLLVSLCLRSESGIVGPATLHLLAFFATALMCHRELADVRPRAEDLTQFYLWMSLGGVLGGAFNVLVAPLVFNSPVEYPLALFMAFALRPRKTPASSGLGARAPDLLYPLLLGVAIWLVYRSPKPPEEWFAMGSQLVFLTAMFIVFFFWKRPVRLALGAAAMYAAAQLASANAGNMLMQDRSFFGTYRVLRITDNHLFQHGTTNHGGQSLDPTRRTEPLTYYYRGGPVSDLFATIATRPERRVAVVGLGVGTLACYGTTRERWTFYEIDPLVADIAATPRWFTYMRDCPPQKEVVLGDARLKLESAQHAEYDFILLDAFSSDAVPTHLMTREALALYLTKLRPGGVVVFHISNRYLDLRPVLTALATDARLAGAIGEKVPDRLGRELLYDGSRWIVLAQDPSVLAPLLNVTGWQVLGSSPASRLWTDDYTDVLSAISW